MPSGRPRATASSRRSPREVGDPEGPDLALVHEATEPLHGLLERMGAGGVEQVDVEPVGPEAAKAAVARLDGATVGGVGRQDLRHEEDFVPTAPDRLANHLLDGSGTVHLGGVDVGHAELDAPPQCSDRLRAVTFHRPGALADDRDHDPGGAEGSSLHRVSRFRLPQGRRGASPRRPGPCIGSRRPV